MSAEQPDDGMAGLIRAAKWSDAFFNYVPAEQANSEFWAGEKPREEWPDLIRPMADQFLEANPDCPYDAAWLVREFINRV